MSQLGCPCGHTISDTTDNLPDKGDILPDTHQEQFFCGVADELAGYIEAVREGRTEAWLKKTGYLRLGLGDSDIVHDWMAGRFLNLKRTIYECEACGRILIETGEKKGDALLFQSYSPDNGKFNAILAPRK